MTDAELESLRREIDRVDRAMLELIARRLEVADEIGLTKRKDGLDIRDDERETKVVEKTVEDARALGIDEELARTIAGTLIGGAVRTQERNAGLPLEGRTTLVIGGGGRMGAWISRFMSNRGATVKVWDPRRSLVGYTSVDSLEDGVAGADHVVVASPLGLAKGDLEGVVSEEPEGVVFDLCSVKSHIAATLRKGVERGLRISSVHPMFGPSAVTPRGRNILVCSCGSTEADADCTELFETAGAVVSAVDLDVHDRLIAYVLGASHASSLAFGKVVAGSGIPSPELRRCAGPSFDKHARLALDVSCESRRVYHDIQRLNPHTERLMESLAEAVRAVSEASSDEGPDRFARLMDDVDDYFGGWFE